MMATTLSLVAIFAPVGFMSGMVGRFMQSFGLTMAFAVLVSLFVSFTLTPMMSALLAEAAAERRAPRLEAQPAVRAARSRLHAHARVVDGASRPGGGRRRAGAAVERAAVPHHRRQLHAGGRSVAVRRHACARPRAPAWRRWTCSPTALGTAVRQIPEVDYTLVTVAGDAAGTLNTATHLVRLHPIEERAARSVRGDGRGPRSDPAGLREGGHAHRGAAAAAVRAAAAAASSS